jgi:hypothetical protein
MKPASIVALFLTISFNSFGQNIDSRLKAELDSIYALDQKYRALMQVAQQPHKADSLARFYRVEKSNLTDHLWSLQNDVDETNMERVEGIIKQYGYPGESVVGSPANEAVFYVIQHSDKIDQYLPLVEKAAQEKQLPFRLFAMMKDRSLMQDEKEQIYGTQASGFSTINKSTGKAEWIWIIWPIADPANVNKRRKEAGFDKTVEENARRLNVDYKVLTIDEVNKMKVR